VVNQRPVAIGLLLYEQVIVEEYTRNVTPINCFKSRKLAVIPGSAGFMVLAWLADGAGTMPMSIIVDRLDTMEEVFRLDRALKFDNPLDDVRLIARIRDCDFPVVGYCQLSLIIDGDLVAHRKFHVSSKEDDHGETELPKE